MWWRKSKEQRLKELKISTIISEAILEHDDRIKALEQAVEQMKHPDFFKCVASPPQIMEDELSPPAEEYLSLIIEKIDNPDGSISFGFDVKGKRLFTVSKKSLDDLANSKNDFDWKTGRKED